MELELTNKVTGQRIQLLSENKDFIIQKVDFGQVKGRHSTTQYINLVGSEIDATVLGTRDISIKGTVCSSAANNLAEKKSRLNRLINPRHDLIISIGKYQIKARPDSSIKYGVGYQENNNLFCEFLISCSAYEPVFKRINEEVFYYSSANKVPLFPLIIPKSKGICFGKISSISTKNVPNDGDIETGFVVRFIADEGGVTNPKITNNKTGKFIEVIVNMLKDDIVELSTVTGNKHVKFIRGNTETDIFKLVSKKSTMSMTLNTGVNDIAITAARNASNLNNIIKFTPLYLEVQE
ncbi:phage distal tail protein [Aminipila sp.]|uniref:phage distal tail protein n=1 Tax=Aminipila sp. TaxID=2060095 RepID=UPI0028A14A57|nr:phage tail domain-containing protein [Aminipila sp.]